MSVHCQSQKSSDGNSDSAGCFESTKSPRKPVAESPRPVLFITRFQKIGRDASGGQEASSMFAVGVKKTLPPSASFACAAFQSEVTSTSLVAGSASCAG